MRLTPSTPAAPTAAWICERPDWKPAFSAARASLRDAGSAALTAALRICSSRPSTIAPEATAASAIEAALAWLLAGPPSAPVESPLRSMKALGAFAVLASADGAAAADDAPLWFVSSNAARTAALEP